MIQIQNIDKSYQDKKVLSEVSFNLPKQKIIAIVGSNGAGKSTLINIIARTLAMDHGDVLLNGQPIKDIKNNQLSRQLSILNQSNHLNLRLTVRELVEFGRFPYSKNRLNKEDLKQVKLALEITSMTELQDRYLDQLSGGQRQMAYIAMVIAQDTPYLFLDEPLNNLDMKKAVQIMKLLETLRDDYGKTILLVIHDINFVSCYADYIFALKDGQLIAEGNTVEVINSPILKEIYGMDINIHEINQQRICVYY
ncbi:MAG: ATP-binding cassette domain-containing protein [Erysipelothrix sp.]|nr:ATP-binding cassette domain-containing protein [Erysipelothrix sp.]